MTRVDVLAPVRIETRFVADGADDWIMHVRVYPDDFSLARPPQPPTDEELDVLEDALETIGPAADPGAAADAAFRSAAAALGGRRAWWLWRTATAIETGPDGVERRTVDRAGAAAGAANPGKPLGLPDALDVWLVLGGGVRLAETLTLNPDGILADLEVDALRPAGRRLPRLWWLDYERATELGLATAVRLSAADVDRLDALVVVGSGQTSALDLLESHAASGRLGTVAQGTPTNTVAGRPAAPLADDAETWLQLLALGAADQPATRDVFTAFGAMDVETAPPVPGGDVEHGRVARLAVQALWPVLWGRTFRDIVGMPAGSTTEPDLAAWATDHLATQGPWPAIRVGDQPYGLIPTSDFGVADEPNPGDVDVRWIDDPDDDPGLAALERSILPWAVPWRDGAARAAATATTVTDESPVVGAQPATLLGLHGRHAPSAFWRVRRVGDLADVQARQIAQGLAVSQATPFDRAIASAWHGNPFPIAPVAADSVRRHLPGPVQDEEADPGLLQEMLTEHPEPLYYNDERPLGLFGHLLRESMIIARATIGRAWLDLQSGLSPDPARPIPLDENYPNVVMEGTDERFEDVAASGSEGKLIIRRFDEVRDALARLIEEYLNDTESTLRAIKATLDAASFRVDPWLLGVARRRVGRLASIGAPFLLGAYGWVDRPRPWTPGRPGLPPGPTEAGLLHAPSHAQAQVSAVLRDAAVHNPDDGRWDIALTSGRVRDAVSFGERVRLGVHPFEALGLEVEAMAGDPDIVRTLRRAFPTTAEASEAGEALRRVCDGVAVLQAARTGTLPAGLPPDLASRLIPLEDLLDTYADLLLVDGVHALMTRSPEAGGAAMEAAAGLSTPPELRGIRTPREATTVAVSCWVVLPPGQDAGEDTAPVAVADPAFAALVGDAIDDPASAAVVRALRLLGGSEAAAEAVPDHPQLMPAMVENLRARRSILLDRVASAHATLNAQEAALSPADVDLLLRLWQVEVSPEGDDWTAEDRRAQAAAILAARLEAAGGDAPTALSTLQAHLRALVGRPGLPVVPVVDRDTLPRWTHMTGDGLERDWLEIVAAVRPRVAPLEAHQLMASPAWPAALDAPGGDPWARTGPVHVAFGSGLTADVPRVAVALLDRWTDSIPSQHHVTQAAFGFNAPKTRAPNAVLLAVPSDPRLPLEGEALLNVVRQVRSSALARAARPTDREALPWATPFPIVQAQDPVDIRKGWP